MKYEISPHTHGLNVKTNDGDEVVIYKNAGIITTECCKCGLIHKKRFIIKKDRVIMKYLDKEKF